MSLAAGLVLIMATPLESQDQSSTAARVQWSMVDVVLVPDTCYGIWLLAAPSVETSNWDRGSQIVQLAVDPNALFQWASTAQALADEPKSAAIADSVLFRATPRLHGRSPGRFLMLARDMKAEPDQRLQLIVVDSASDTHWKTFGTAEELRRLLSVIEDAVARAPFIRPAANSSLAVADQAAGFAPAVQLDIPKPHYPGELRARRRAGRVWTEYVVGIDGRMENGSLRILLADHESFAAAAAAALKRATFRPATRGGIPVRQRVFQALSFRIEH